MKLPQWTSEHLLLLTLVIVGLGLAWLHANTLDNFLCLNLCYEQHTSIIEGTAAAPYRWRVLSAGLAQALTFLNTPLGVQFGYNVAHTFMFPLALLFAYRWLRKSAAPVFAFAACILMAWLITLGLDPYGIALFSVVELVIVAWGLSLLPNDRWNARLTYALLILVGSFNRETTALILAAAYGAWMLPRWRERHTWVWGTFYAALMVGTYIMLRVWLGDAPPMLTFAFIWEYNTTGKWAQEAIVRNVLILPIWLLGAAGFRHAGAPLRRLALVMLVYVPPTLVYGIWGETRLQWTLWLIAAAWTAVWMQHIARERAAIP